MAVWQNRQRRIAQPFLFYHVLELSGIGGSGGSFLEQSVEGPSTKERIEVV